MDTTKLLQFLHDLYHDGSEAVLAKGFRWFQDTFTSNLKIASQELNNQPELLAESWLIAGEVHELLDAPLQALTCYQVAAHFHLENPDIYHWTALVQEQLGDYVQAMENIDLAMKFTQDGTTLMEDRQRIQDCMVYDKVPDYQRGNLVWQYSEFLAEGSAEVIIQAISASETSNIEILRCLYKAYGIDQEIAKGEAVWQQILSIDQTVELDDLDRFYWT